MPHDGLKNGTPQVCHLEIARFHGGYFYCITYRVVDDEDIPAHSARQRCDSLLDDGRAQEQRELALMDGAGVQEAVERIPLKRDGLWRILLPLVEGTPLEHRLERDEEDGHDRKAAQLVGIAAPQDLADMELSKESLNLGRSDFTGVMMMWYNIHSISPPGLLWILVIFIIQNGNGLCYFYFADCC